MPGFRQNQISTLLCNIWFSDISDPTVDKMASSCACVRVTVPGDMSELPPFCCVRGFLATGFCGSLAACFPLPTVLVAFLFWNAWNNHLKSVYECLNQRIKRLGRENIHKRSIIYSHLLLEHFHSPTVFIGFPRLLSMTEITSSERK